MFWKKKGWLRKQFNDQLIERLQRYRDDWMGKKLDTIPVPESEWLQIREQFIRQQTNEDEHHEQEDPFIAEAKKWFGEHLIEIKE